MSIVRVALDIPLHTLFDYTVDEPVVVGQRVIVPFRHRSMVGLVIECEDTTSVSLTRIKPVSRVLHDIAPISDSLLKIMKFCSDYYHYPIGQSVMSALPASLRGDKPIPIKSVPNYRLRADIPSFETVSSRKVVARRLLEKLALHSCTRDQLNRLSTSASAQLNWLIKEGWVEEFDSPVQRQSIHTFSCAHKLTGEQKLAVDGVTKSSGFHCFLLHGITGSGKTEVYVHLMDEVLHRGGQILLLVPEINLTPQLEGYFLSRFPDTALVSLHSGMSDNARFQNWQRAQTGVAQIILGTRSSVFTELPQLALIIVDEEHDSSFKQQDGLRYSARDVAIFRANGAGIPIVLGSATPSFESYHNAKTGRYSLLTLTGRAQIEARLPEIKCIQIKQTVMHEGISVVLLHDIERCLARGEQSLLFINRRGYAPVMMCRECGWLSDCKHCAGKMVLHLKEKRLRCHHCGYQLRMPTVCPGCAHPELHPVGSGTQRVESILQSRFPDARILRVDRDSTRNKRAWQKMRDQIHANEVDILVGTQMLAKGHDFPALTLVGVLDPDGALYSGDFRAAEKLFAQLMQVAGRAGRSDKPGTVLIQTEFPDHPLFRFLQNHDFDGWAALQLAERRMAGFPPFAFQVILRAEGMSESEVYAYLNQARQAACELKYPVDILGVVPATLARRANHIRAQLLIQADTRRDLQQFLHAWQPHLDSIAMQKLRCSLDIDPLEF